MAARRSVAFVRRVGSVNWSAPQQGAVARTAPTGAVQSRCQASAASQWHTTVRSVSTLGAPTQTCAAGTTPLVAQLRCTGAMVAPSRCARAAARAVWRRDGARAAFCSASPLGGAMPGMPARELKEFTDSLRQTYDELTSLPDEQTFDPASRFSSHADLLYEFMSEVLLYPEYSFPVGTEDGVNNLFVAEGSDGAMVLHTTTSEEACLAFIDGLKSSGFDKPLSAMPSPGARIVDMLDSLQSHMAPAKDGGHAEIHLAIDHHDPVKGMTLQSAYTDAALRQVADSLRIEFLLRMLNMVPTDPELSFEQPLVQEAMQAVLDFEGYSMLGVVPEEDVKAGKQKQRVLGVLHSPVPNEALSPDVEESVVEAALHKAVDNLSVLVFTHTALAIRFLYHHGVPLSPTEEDGLDVPGPTRVIPLTRSGHDVWGRVAESNGIKPDMTGPDVPVGSCALVNAPIFTGPAGDVLKKELYCHVLLGATEDRLNTLIRVRNDEPATWLHEAVKRGMLKPKGAGKASKGSKRAGSGPKGPKTPKLKKR